MVIHRRDKTRERPAHGATEKTSPASPPVGTCANEAGLPWAPRTGGLTREEGQRHALGAYRSPRDPDAFTSFHPHAALPGGHDDLPSPAEKTEPQTGSRIGARRLQRRAPGEAATAPVRKCFSPAHVAPPGSRVTKWGPESRETPFQSPGEAAAGRDGHARCYT